MTAKTDQRAREMHDRTFSTHMPTARFKSSSIPCKPPKPTLVRKAASMRYFITGHNKVLHWSLLFHALCSSLKLPY